MLHKISEALKNFFVGLGLLFTVFLGVGVFMGTLLFIVKLIINAVVWVASRIYNAVSFGEVVAVFLIGLFLTFIYIGIKDVHKMGKEFRERNKENS